MFAAARIKRLKKIGLLLLPILIDLVTLDCRYTLRFINDVDLSGYNLLTINN